MTRETDRIAERLPRFGYEDGTKYSIAIEQEDVSDSQANCGSLATGLVRPA